MHLGITAFIVVVLSIFFRWLLENSAGLRDYIALVIKALSPIIIGLFFAVLLDKPSQALERNLFIPLFSRGTQLRKSTKNTKVSAIILTQFLTWFFIIGLITLVFPQIYRSIVGLISNADTYATNARKWAENLLKNNPQLEDYAISIINSISVYLKNWLETDLLPQFNNIIASITEGVFIFLRGILNVLIGIVISFYLMINKDVFLAQCKKLLYSVFKVKTANNIMDFFTEVEKAFGGFFAGKILDSVIIGIICYISLTIMKMPYSALVSLIIGVTNIIPVFGPFIGAVPSAVIILFESPLKCLIFIIFVLVIQQFDGNILGPKILGSSIGLSGFWIMFSILLFGGLFSFTGMLLGVPIFTVIYGLVKRGTKAGLEEKGLPSETDAYLNIAEIDAETNKPVYKNKDE